MQKRVYKKCLNNNVGSIKNAKVCGVIMCYFMLANLKGKKSLANIDYMGENVRSLTQKQKMELVNESTIN